MLRSICLLLIAFICGFKSIAQDTTFLELLYKKETLNGTPVLSMKSGRHEFLIKEQDEIKNGYRVITLTFDGENYELCFKENEPTKLLYLDNLVATIDKDVTVQSTTYFFKKTDKNKFSYKLNNKTVLDGEIKFYQMNNKIIAGPDLYFREYQGINQKPLKILALYYSAREIDTRIHGKDSFLLSLVPAPGKK